MELKEVFVDVAIWISVAVVVAAAIGAGVARYFDKSDWRNVAESRGAEIEDNDRRIEDLENRVKLLEAQILGMAVIKSEQIAHLVLEGLNKHGGI